MPVERRAKHPLATDVEVAAVNQGKHAISLFVGRLDADKRIEHRHVQYTHICHIAANHGKSMHLCSGGNHGIFIQGTRLYRCIKAIALSEVLAVSASSKMAWRS